MFKSLLPASKSSFRYQEISAAPIFAPFRNFNVLQPFQRQRQRRSIVPLETFGKRRYTTIKTMADLTVELTAPNGTRYVQPTGLFINNEWVAGSDGEMITSINPSYVLFPLCLSSFIFVVSLAIIFPCMFASWIKVSAVLRYSSG